jgi:hypothetical protein
VSWIDSTAMQIVCAKCGGGNLIGHRGYDTLQGKIFLIYCFDCQPEKASDLEYKQSPEYQKKVMEIFRKTK